MSIETELQEITGVTKKKREERAAYLERLVQAALDVAQDQWESLSEAAQLWVNAGIKLLNANQSVEDFEPEPEEEPAAEEEPAPPPRRERPVTAKKKEEPAEEAEEEPAPKRPSKPAPKAASKPAPKAAPRKAAASKSDKGKKPAAKTSNGGKSAQVVIRELVLADPKITPSELGTKLEELDYNVSPSTITTTKAGFIQSIRVLQEGGLLKRRIV